MITWIDRNSRFFQCGSNVKVPLGYESPGWYIWNLEGVIGPFTSEEEAEEHMSRVVVE